MTQRVGEAVGAAVGEAVGAAASLMTRFSRPQSYQQRFLILNVQNASLDL
ncbi:MAG: hypothetical protein K0U58_12630 [Gammaproteobacteria bacterium]|nr:hypothetical protein [Gammaproteobacteria bacterium]